MGSYTRTMARKAYQQVQKNFRRLERIRRKLPWWKCLLNKVSGGALKLS